MRRTEKQKSETIKVPVICGQVLGVKVMRGYARLCDLARASKADVYDQKDNPAGTQRDLSPKHARAAYEYVTNHELAFWPEVFLSARNPKVIKYTPYNADPDIGELVIDLSVVASSKDITISRIDGNHRLHYADGTQKDFPAIEQRVSFCLAYELSLEEEITLFRDINDNQKPMNTSHLDNIEVRLTPKERLKRENPELWIAQELGHDPKSPLHNLVYEGGKKTVNRHINLRTLRTGITYMFSRPTKLTDLPHPDAQYKVIRNYFSAVKKWQPQAWESPRKYLVLRSTGLWAICFIGADVIDRVLAQGAFSPEEMLKVLKSGKDWDWSAKGNFKGLGGRGGASQIRQSVVNEFQTEGGPSIKQLWQEIMKE